ncbi:pilus assembly protein N-terminal domain-containing protein [Asticcacaulis sp. 201]|uniref:pilus assembly protein N-terminal domain-containing protein n=1 Tax=Asticcacaulis sp. 201 TaxID=3028787 RepID=UPI0029161DB0|nr:pilus assembly protein N-terminal domain-containing protein [Asticcacaulis sp. 201]MDV6332069.1 pilus assembly protein N-terminal domain-containing protein [Asticcacaulis sp. 201]
MTKHMIGTRLCILAASIACAAALTGTAEAGQRLTVAKNHTMRVTLNGSAGAVIVANPDIADVQVIDSRTIYIVGKGFGNSAVTVTGRDGRTLFDGEIIVNAAQKGAINVYKGLKSSLTVCSNVCISEDATSENTSASAPPAPVATPVVTSSPVAMQSVSH